MLSVICNVIWKFTVVSCQIWHHRFRFIIYLLVSCWNDVVVCKYGKYIVMDFNLCKRRPSAVIGLVVHSTLAFSVRRLAGASLRERALKLI